MNECSPPAGVHGAPCEERRKGERERRFGHSAKRWMSPRGVCPSANLRERAKRTRETDGESEDETVVWTKGFNKWISTKLNEQGGEKDIAHTHRLSKLLPHRASQAWTRTHCPPLREGPHMTQLGQPIHTHHSPLLTPSPFLSLLPLALFLLPFFLDSFFLFEFLGPGGTLGSKERSLSSLFMMSPLFLWLSGSSSSFKASSLPLFSFSSSLLSFFKRHKRPAFNVQDVFSRTWTGF